VSQDRRLALPKEPHNYFGAVMLFVFGIIYGVLADGIASWAMQRKPGKPA